MDTSTGIAILGFIAIGIMAIVYYSNPKLHTCSRCGKHLHHNKGRYWDKVNGESVPVCSTCAKKERKQHHYEHSTPVEERACSRCSKVFTPRMQKWEFKPMGQKFVLCASCKRTLLNLKFSKPLDEMLTPDFLAKCSDFVTLDDMIDSYSGTIEGLDDFETTEWNDWVKDKTSYDSWESMFNEARNIAIEQAQIEKIKNG